MQPDAIPDLPTDQSGPDVLLVPPTRLVERFGMPTRRPAVGDTATGEFIFLRYADGRFVRDDGWAEFRDEQPTDVFALFAEGLPAPLEFWASPVPEEFHLTGFSGRRERRDFIQWLLTETDDR